MTLIYDDSVPVLLTYAVPAPFLALLLPPDSRSYVSPPQTSNGDDYSEL